MKKITLALMLLLTVAQVSACNKEEKKADDASAKAPEAAAPKAASSYDCSAVTVDSLKSKAKTTDKNKKKVLENDSYATILESLQCCTVDEKTFAIDKKSCVAHQTLDALKKDNILLPSLDTVAAQLAKHESPIVRGHAYASFSGLFGANAKDISIAKTAIQTEKDPYALQQLVAGLSNEGGKDPEVGKFLLEMSKHENAFIRRKAAIALASTWSEKLEGAVDTVITLMNDADPKTAEIACAGAGKLHNEKVIEPIVTILNDDTKVNLHDDCIGGLAALWIDYPTHKQHNEAAYQATMNYFKKTPRTNKIPVWSGIAAFNTVANTRGELDAWKSEATWFKIDEFTQVMTDLIKDPNMNWLGKAPAMKAIKAYGGKAALESIASTIEGVTGPQADNIKKAYQTELNSAK